MANKLCSLLFLNSVCIKNLWIWFLYRLMCMGHVWVLMNREDHQLWRAETSSSASVTESISFGGTLSPWRRAWWAPLFLSCTQYSHNWPIVNCFSLSCPLFWLDSERRPRMHPALWWNNAEEGQLYRNGVTGSPARPGRSYRN